MLKVASTFSQIFVEISSTNFEKRVHKHDAERYAEVLNAETIVAMDMTT